MGAKAARSAPRVEERVLPSDTDPLLLLRRARLRGGPSIFLDGRGSFDRAWESRLAWDARRVTARSGATAVDAELLDRLVRDRRERGGTSATGIVALVAFEALEGEPRRESGTSSAPRLVLFEVDRAVRFPRDGPPVLVTRGEAASVAEALEAASIDRPGAEGEDRSPPAVAARASLSREAYLAAVGRVRKHIAAGDIYQANLTTSFEAPFVDDPLRLFRRVRRALPAPRSAFVEFDAVSVISASPEVFLDAIPDGTLRTVPIKGTRPRGEDPESDRRLAADLLASEKDRAELVMIVDLERNDLGRVCVPGSIRVAAPPALRSYSAVHHLVAEVEGRLRPDVGAKALLEATFPGGSISGAPKLRALEILRTQEPAERGYYTGSLFWFGDDGSMESSILIRTIVVAEGVARVGAGGGIVADSDPEAEWREVHDKARGLTRALGFEPEEAR